MASKIYIGFIVAFLLFFNLWSFKCKEKIIQKQKELLCQKSDRTFEKIYKKDIQKAKELLKSSIYIINSYIESIQKI